MGTEIIPTIFALDKFTFEKKLEKLKFVRKIHIDFMDGEFTKTSQTQRVSDGLEISSKKNFLNKSIQIDDMKNILKYPNTIFEIHLMAKNPIQYIDDIKKLNIRKVLIQEEVLKDEVEIKKTIRKFKDEKFKLFIVLNPNTNINRILKFLKLIDGIMLMSVWAGAEGQEFIEKTYQKIKEIRSIVGSDFPLQIDGGIKESNFDSLVSSSAQIFSVGSFISSSENPENNYKKLQNMIDN